MSDISPKACKVVTFLGMFGGACRGAAFAVAGGFAIAAALHHKADKEDKAKGMDDTLRSFADTPAGPLRLLVLIALGLAAYGAFSWANTRWRKV